MKNLITFLFVAWVTVSNAQITLENTYLNITPFYSTFILAYVGPSGMKYIYADSNQIQVYNLDHSLFTSFAIPLSAHSQGYNVFLVTENLFDTDSTTIEYLVHNWNSSSTVKIFRNDGTQIFNEDSADFVYPITAPANPVLPQWTPIAVTDSGVKMILLKTRDRIKVFNLPGTLPKCCCDGSLLTGMGNLQPTSPLGQLKGYPNPSYDQTTIEYALPNDVSSGDLIIYNVSGIEMKRYAVTNKFSSIVLNVGDLPSGTYYYQLKAPGLVTGKKMIIMK